MGFAPGKRYLKSTSSFGDGTAIGSIVAWQIDGDTLTLVPGMYKTNAIGQEFAAVTSWSDALALVAPGAAKATKVPTPSSQRAGDPGSSSSALIAVLAVAATLALGSGVVLLLRRRPTHL